MTLQLPLTVDMGAFVLTLDPSLYPDNVPDIGLNWLHCQYNPTSGSLFTSLHLDNDDLVDSITKVHVADANGMEIIDEASFDVEIIEENVQVTYVTTRNNFNELVVHFHNYGNETYSIDQVDINTGFLLSSNEPIILHPSGHSTRVFDVSELHLKEVDVWTVMMSINGKLIGYGGRLLKELFPIEDWPKSDQCPYPVKGANNENYELLKNEQSINTHYFKKTCDASEEDVFAAAVASEGDLYLLPSGKFYEEAGRIPDSAYPAIAALFLGDESDSSDNATWDIWSRALIAQNNYDNRYAVYDGGHSNHLNGRYAGVSDIQGMDFYVAGCAPYITNWLTTEITLMGAFDYLYTARQNQKPLPTWLYSQGYCTDCWSVHQLHSGELVMQLASVLAAGGKGLMLFQSDVRAKTLNPDSWYAGGRFLKSVSFVSDFLRVGDIEGAKYTVSGDNLVITQVLVDPTSLMFLAISTDASGYNSHTCFLTNRHWIFNEQTISSIEIELPEDLTLLAARANKSPSEYFNLVEVVEGAYISNPGGVEMFIDDSNQKIIIQDLKLGVTDDVARMLMLLPLQ